MAALTDEEIRALTSIEPADTPVTSCYLDIDGGRHIRPADYERVLDGLLDSARRRPEFRDGVAADFDRIAERVRDGFDRSRVKGVALFASAAHDLFVVHELPVPVRSEIVLNPRAVVAQLELIAQQSQKIAVLAVDKTHTRVLVFRLGELLERAERTDDLGRDYDTVGEHDRGTPDDHRDALVDQHVRAAAELLWQVYQDGGFDHIVLAATDPVASAVEPLLHPYLRERLHGRLDCSAQASEAELRDAAIEAERRIEREREARLVEQLRSAVGAGDKAVTGIDAVLDAVAAKRVETLLVSDGYHREGWRCPTCARLATVGRACTCGAEMDHIADVVGAAIDETVQQSCRVVVCDGNADLDVLGQVGALLRY